MKLLFLFVKNKLMEANKCLFVLRTLHPTRHRFFVCSHCFLPKITYGLSVYGAASPPDLNTVQKFLTRCTCYKRNHISHHVNVSELVEKSDLPTANRICKEPSHPLFNLLPRLKKAILTLEILEVCCLS